MSRNKPVELGQPKTTSGRSGSIPGNSAISSTFYQRTLASDRESDRINFRNHHMTHNSDLIEQIGTEFTVIDPHSQGRVRVTSPGHEALVNANKAGNLLVYEMKPNAGTSISNKTGQSFMYLTQAQT